MMTDWYQKAIDALQLNGLGERTQEAYVRAVRMLCQFYDKTPDQISESELQQYFLHRKNRDGWSPNTMRICYCGIRFFFVHVVQRNWHTLGLIRAQSEHRLPGGAQSRGGTPAARLCAHPAQSGLPQHRLCLRPAPAGGPVPGGLGYRQ